MKLIYSPTSPYARKARIVIIERGIEGVEMLAVDPFDPATLAINPNPLGKVPTLILDDGSALYDSPVICAYLLRSGAEVERCNPDWGDMRMHVLADGIIDAAFAVVMEGRRPEDSRSAYWVDRWRVSIGRAVHALEEEAEALAGAFGMTPIAVACALGYLDFRLVDLPWRDDHPGLSAWFAEARMRPSMIRTDPAV